MNHMYIYLIAAVVLSMIPVVRTFFSTLHTMIHETGHALTALLTSGRVHSISLYANTGALLIQVHVPGLVLC